MSILLGVEAAATGAVATVLVAYSYLFQPLRESRFGRLFRCPLCLGFWVGALFAAIDTRLPAFIDWTDVVWYYVKVGLLTSLASYCLHYLVVWIGHRTDLFDD